MSLGLLDQGLSSASNSVMLIAIARVSSPAEFGAFSIAYLALTVCMSVGRGLVGARIVLLANQTDAIRVEARHALGFSLAAGLSVSVVAVPLVVTLGLGALAMTLGALVAVVLAQDALRFVAVAYGRAQHAAVSDGLWLLGGLLALGLTATGLRVSPIGVLSAWAVSALTALAYLSLRLGVSPTFRGLGRWLRESLGFRLALGAEGFISAANALVISALAGASLSLASVAALRGAGTLIGPISLLMNSLPLVLVPEIRQVGAQLHSRRLLPPLVRVAFVLSACSLVVGSSPYWLPEAIGPAILGATWPLAATVLPIIGIEYVGLSFMFVAGVGLRSAERARQLLILQLCYSATTLAAVIFVIERRDVRYVAGASAATAILYGAATMLVLAACLRRKPHDTPSARRSSG